MHIMMLSSEYLACSIIALMALTMATIREPKQMLPRLVVVARRREPETAGEQQEEATAGSNHHVPTVPATET